MNVRDWAILGAFATLCVSVGMCAAIWAVDEIERHG